MPIFPPEMDQMTIVKDSLGFDAPYTYGGFTEQP